MSASGTEDKDRISTIIDCLNDPTLDLPESLKSFKYEDGFNEDKLEEELEQIPFFMTEFPDPSKPLPPLLEAFQQLKYSETDNTHHELACNHKEDGVYHFKLKKYRIASACFTTAISHELKEEAPDLKFVAQLYNNRSACSWFLQNYRTCVKDCEAALKYDCSYFKAFKRCVLALVELRRWGEVEEKLGGWGGDDEESFGFVCEMRVKARKGIVSDRFEERGRAAEEKGREEVRNRIVGMIKDRGVRVSDFSFLVGEAASNGRVVAVGEDGGLKWPVLFMYPQYSQSDLVEGFPEGDCFSTHLAEMLDGENRPPWDVDKEYDSSNVDVYYLNRKLCKLDLNATLLDVLKQPTYLLPGNGVPCFFVLAKGNRFCEDFIERVEVD